MTSEETFTNSYPRGIKEKERLATMLERMQDEQKRQRDHVEKVMAM